MAGTPNLTFGAFKTAIRLNLFPQGEAQNLVAPHNKMFIDALIDLQTVVECLQTDNYTSVDQCATFYKCGFTILDCPRGNIKLVSVVDRRNPTTGQEDPTAPIVYCGEIPYVEVDYRHVERYFNFGRRGGCLPALGPFFCVPHFPVPTDAGLPAGLPVLPLGIHYAQTSTDRTHGRSHHGIWAKDRQNIWIAPWIQSTETVLVKWDGIKRIWTDGDPIDDDPLLAQAVEDYVRWKDAEVFDQDYEAAARAQLAYEGSPGSPGSKQKLVYQCREETRVRYEERSLARSANPTVTGNLYYNDTAASATATCPAGQTGTPVTVTIAVGTVSSTVSVADANSIAAAQAQSQAQQQLVCSTTPKTFSNVSYTNTYGCTSDDPNAPTPDGNPVTITIPAGTYNSTISQADADQQAVAAAAAAAAQKLSCTWWNSPQTFTAVCASNSAFNVTVTIPQHSYSSTVSQEQANALALAAATNQANAQLVSNGQCSGVGQFFNTVQIVTVNYNCFYQAPPGQIGTGPRNYTIIVTVPAHTISAQDQATANQLAVTAGNQWGNTVGAYMCHLGGIFPSGQYAVNYQQLP